MHTNCPNCPIVLTVLLSGLDSEAFSPSASLSQAYPIMCATLRSSSAGRSGERGIERAVGSAVDVDEAPLVDVGVALLHDWHVCSLRSKEKWRDALVYLHHATCQSVMDCILPLRAL